MPVAVVGIAATLLTTLLSPAQAHAHACDRTDNDRREASRVIRDLTGEIDDMERAIIEALRLQTGQLSGYIAQSARAVSGALDSQTRLQAQIEREAAETEAMRARRPSESACNTITGLAGLAASGEASAIAHARASAIESGRITGDRAVVDRPGAAAGDAARFAVIAQNYCNAARAGEDTRAGDPALSGRSVPGTSVCRGEDALHGADLRAGTLFDQRTFASEAELRAAVELSRNLAAPVVHDPPALASADTDRERRRVLLARAANARSALAADYLSQSRALRVPGAALGDWAAALRQGPGRDPDNPVSRYELLELLASGRFEEPDWFVGLQAMSAENLLRELVTLQAVSLMLDWQRYRTDERRGAIDAASLALAVEEMRRLPGLANPLAGAN
ncbi:MAG: hypothetical protein OXO52_17305 [Rhodospirillales bacterium]|nr:hypothetical protein [Rhodospirillales bacterium]MDE0378505.1 hypothetical protein [Rhodospirillales bacterium]